MIDHSVIIWVLPSLGGKHWAGFISQNSLTKGEGWTPIWRKLSLILTISSISWCKGTVWELQALAAKAEALIHRLFSSVSSFESSPHRQTSAPRIRFLSTPSGKTVKLL